MFACAFMWLRPTHRLHTALKQSRSVLTHTVHAQLNIQNLLRPLMISLNDAVNWYTSEATLNLELSVIQHTVLI